MVPPPEIPGWVVWASAGSVVLGLFNWWRFRTGSRMLRRWYRPGLTELVIRTGYASVPLVVSSAGMLADFLLFPLVVEHRSALLGYLFLLCAALFFGGSLWGFKESRRPSRWNTTPHWLEEAVANGELPPDLVRRRERQRRR